MHTEAQINLPPVPKQSYQLPSLFFKADYKEQVLLLMEFKQFRFHAKVEHKSWVSLLVVSTFSFLESSRDSSCE